MTEKLISWGGSANIIGVWLSGWACRLPISRTASANFTITLPPAC
jgi:hypothetical protein